MTNSTLLPIPPEQLLPVSLQTLTPREREVLLLILEARTSREIAEALRISRRTAEQHCENLKAKLHARSTMDVLRIVATAERLGLVHYDQFQARMGACLPATSRH